MAYDALAESTALIEHGLTADPLRLSRRRRFAALAVDVDGDLACTLFTVRGAGHVRRETHLLERRGGSWTPLGGGGSGGGDDDGLADRPSTAELGALLVGSGSGSVLRNAGRRMPWGARYAYDAELRASSDVHSVAVGDRVLTVPRHGHLVVVWSTRRPPSAVARDAAGRPLAELRLPGVGGLPELYRDALPAAADEPGPGGH